MSDLIPRQILFGNPDRIMTRLSPNAQWISYIAPVDGVLNLWIAPRDNPEDSRPITNDTHRGIRTYFWSYDNQHIIYTQDIDGAEDWHLHTVNINTHEGRDLTPFKKIHARVIQLSPKHPGKIMAGINNRVEQLHDPYLIDISTGESSLVMENPGFAGFMADDDMTLRFALQTTPDGGHALLKKSGDSWEPFMQVSMDDALTTSALGFDKSGETLYLSDSRDRNTSALAKIDLQSGAHKIIAEDTRADFCDALTHPSEKTIQAFASMHERKEWQILDKSIQPDFQYLRSLDDGDVEITSRSYCDSFWIVAYLKDTGPILYYLYDRNQKQASYLFSSNQQLESLQLAPMQSHTIKTRDGLEMVVYLSLPHGTNGPVPLVLDVHGGPQARDSWGYSGVHQWLTNRGYACMNVNYRGSTGFGKDFINAGIGQWGAKMHDDLIDAVNWAIQQGFADPKNVCIMGGSYGGYATLVGMTQTPEVFSCGIDIVGPSNLLTLIETIPEYWKPIRDMFLKRLGGDPDTPEGKAFLKERSPLTHADKICKPLLVCQGANDPRVKQAEADQIVQALENNAVPLTYLLYPDEGHGLARPENRMSFYAVAEAFLQKYLGGKCEPVKDDFEGSSVQIQVDKDNIIAA